MDADSLQTPTGTGTRLHVAATIVGHKTGLGSTLRCARLKTISVVGVERRGTLIHCAEVPGTPLPMLEAQDYSHPQSQETPQDYNQSLHSIPHVTSCQRKSYHRQHATASRLYKSPDWVLMNRVNISYQPGLHSLRHCNRYRSRMQCNAIL